MILRCGTRPQQPKGAQMSYVLALDQGTTSSRAIVFDEAGKALGLASGFGVISVRLGGRLLGRTGRRAFVVSHKTSTASNVKRLR